MRAPKAKRQLALVETLQAAGMQRDEAALWAGFLLVSLRVVLLACRRLARPAAWAALQQAGPPGRAIGEVDISIGIFHEMDRLKDHADADSPMRDVEFGVEVPVSSPERRGTSSRDMDFRIKRRWGRGATRVLAVEAKLMRAEGDVRQRYLAEEGLGCFLTADSPYTREPVALMLAYSAAAEHPPWAALIAEELGREHYNAEMYEMQIPVGIDIHCTVPRPLLHLPNLSVMHAVLHLPPT